MTIHTLIKHSNFAFNTAKLSERDIPVIRAKIRAGIKTAIIANEYNVSSSAILAIKSKQAWGHVHDEHDDMLIEKSLKPLTEVAIDGATIRTTTHTTSEGAVITLPRISILEAAQ